jgi:hypothetical protein
MSCSGTRPTLRLLPRAFFLITSKADEKGETMSDYDEEHKNKFDDAVETGVGVTDFFSKGLDFASAVTDSEPLEKGAAVAAMPGDTLKLGKGLEEMKDHKDGWLADLIGGGAGATADAAAAAGIKPLATVAGELKAGSEIGDGGRKFKNGLDQGDGMTEVAGIREMLDGVADGAGAAPEKHVAGVGKALGYGMAIGDKLAPVVFGDKNTDSSIQSSDGVWHGSTGNGCVDWVAGAGKYSNSRWGNTAEESAAIDSDFQSKRAELAQTMQNDPEAAQKIPEFIRNMAK